MLISVVVSKMKAYHKGTINGVAIDEAKTRDKILYGNPEQDCSGIVTCCWASVDVIRKAHEWGANLIIVHEALFWNHGDHTDWLMEQGNKTFLAKKQLLDETGIVIWRDHDYIHSGIPVEGGEYADGIFYGLMKILGWEKYAIGNAIKPILFEVPETTAYKIGKEIIEKLALNGIKVVGEIDTKVKRISICFHVMGDGDNRMINYVEQEKIDLLISLELIDYTLSEYIRDSGMVSIPKVILATGHFNSEEPGMEYMVNYIPEALGENIACKYIQSGDMYNFITK